VETLFEREFFGHRKGAFTGAQSTESGFFDAAKGGTLFLDELSELSLAMQVKLLRVLDSGEYTPLGGTRQKIADVRIVAATNKPLSDLLRQGAMRQDFFYRLAVIEIELPPLRDRVEDIPLLVEHFFRQDAPETPEAGSPPFPPHLLERLYHYHWPGNVRELQNVLQRYQALRHLHLPNDVVKSADAGAHESDHATLQEAIETLEQQMICRALEANQWRRGETAARLGIPRQTLLRKIKKYGIREE
jgi:DNA-binding NtrC family response regulator